MGSASIGFIGLGVMGEPMCRNLALRSKRPVIAFDLNHEPLARLAAHGIARANNVPEVVGSADVVFISLPSGEILEKLVQSEEGLAAHARKGQIFVDLGTSGVERTRVLAAKIAARGARYLDAPVARTREAAEAGTLSVMVGGDEKTLAEILPLIQCFASEITHCGGIGAGQVVKTMNNMVLFQTVVALSEALALGRGAGVDGKLLFETLSKGSGDSFALRNHGLKSMVPGNFPERAFPVTYARKDLAYALELAAGLGIDVPGAKVVDALFTRAIEAGFGELYHPVVSKVVAGEK